MVNSYGERKRRRKKKKSDHHRKLLPGENIEVLYSDEGLHGSWHTGVVVACGQHSRQVEYDYLLSNDNCSKLREDIPVSAAIDGRIKRSRNNYRGRIRPSPPSYEFRESEIRYGLCVDALVDDAWWEGVVFDREEASKKRLVLFPDQGDQQMIDVERMRLTQEWNEASGHWTPRGEWLLLRAIQPFELEDALPVSIREIWYDLRTMAAFSDKIGEWTWGTYDTWHSLVLELIQELKSVVHGFIAPTPLLPISDGAIEIAVEDIPCLDVLDILNIGSAATENDFLCSGLLTLDNRSLSDSLLHDNCDEASSLHAATDKGIAVASKTGVCGKEELLLSGLDEVSTNLICNDNNAENNINLPQRGDSTEAKKQRSSDDWTTLDLETAYYPEAIQFCAEHFEERTHQLKILKGTDDALSSARLKAKKHLLALGWKIESTVKLARRVCFTSPEGKRYHSLHKACCGLLKDQEEKHLKSRDEGAYVKKDSPGNGRKPQIENCSLDVRLFEANEDMDLSRTITVGCRALAITSDLGIKDEISPNVSKEHRHTNTNHIVSGKENLASNVSEELLSAYDHIQPGYFPEAVLEYKNYVELRREKTNQGTSHRDLGSIGLYARKHLKFMGWKFWTEKGCLLITSPSGEPFRSLYSACDGYSRAENLSALVLPEEAKTGCTNLSYSSKNRELRFAHLKRHRVSKKKMTSHSSSSAGLGGRLLLKQSSARSSNCESPKNSKAGTGRCHDLSSRISLHGERLSTRLQDTLMETPSQHVASTVLSSLIENDIVLPREKVRYVRRRNGRVLMEGWITHDGIKCKCCKLVYALSDFVAHAGSSTRRPAASIFLQDGRSLLDCQRQLEHCKRPPDFQRSRVKSDYSVYKSDIICSVCHEGGSLLLCDHCPSSFHLSCVGLQDVPKGDWFCPSCRCAICSLTEFDSNTQRFTEKTVLYCDQCEREFHVGCFRKAEHATLRRCPIGNWFCSKKCSKIFLHLQKLLGKYMPTAVKGLSLTILRSGRDLLFDAETAAGHDGKLGVALKILHECFVTIIEPRTHSDFVADLLFNKESELRRLNFYGFYTMILERGDEVIAVATFRVYGAKVAEMPLIGTRVKYRKQGMCRLLVNELEKLLSSLGVERLLLPAVPQLLETWTTSFGFSKMSLSERLDLSEYTILSFEDSIMCQKLLGTSTTDLVETKVSEVETVEPLKMLPFLGVERSKTPGEDDHLRISCLTETAHSLSTSDRMEVTNPIEQTLPETRVNDQLQLHVFPGNCCDSSVSVDISPPALVKPSTYVNFGCFRRCYKRISKSNSPRRKKLFNSITANALKHFYRRKSERAALLIQNAP